MANIPADVTQIHNGDFLLVGDVGRPIADAHAQATGNFRAYKYTLHLIFVRGNRASANDDTQVSVDIEGYVLDMDGMDAAFTRGKRLALVLSNPSSITQKIAGWICHFAQVPLPSSPTLWAKLQTKYPNLTTDQVYLALDATAEEVIERPSRKGLARIGPTLVICRKITRFYMSIFPNSMGSQTTAVFTDPSEDVRNHHVRTFYLNAFLSSLSANAFLHVKRELTTLIADDVLEHWIPTDAEMAALPIKALPYSRLVYLAFFCVASLAKDNDSKGITEWIKNRTSALYAKLHIIMPPVLASTPEDIPRLSNMYKVCPELKLALLAPMLYTTYRDVVFNETEIALRSQVQLVLSFYQMGTFRLSKLFGDSCATEANIIQTVLTQSRAIDEEYTRVENLCRGLPHIIDFYCVFNERPAAMETSKYPDVAYCAIVMKKALSGGSWDNYNVGNIETNVPKQELKQKLARHLAVTGVDPTLVTPEVSAWLTAHDRVVEATPTINQKILNYD